MEYFSLVKLCCPIILGLENGNGGALKVYNASAQIESRNTLVEDPPTDSKLYWVPSIIAGGITCDQLHRIVGST